MYSSYSGHGSNSAMNSLLKSSSASADNSVWIIISAVIAVIGGIVLYFTFLSRKNEGKYTGFLGWMYEFLTFKKMVIENILKILYLVIASFITLASFAIISRSFLSFIIVLVVGNLITRIMYELFLVVLIICRNTTDISKKLDKKEIVDKKEESNKKEENQ